MQPGCVLYKYVRRLQAANYRRGYSWNYLARFHFETVVAPEKGTSLTLCHVGGMTHSQMACRVVAPSQFSAAFSAVFLVSACICEEIYYFAGN